METQKGQINGDVPASYYTYLTLLGINLAHCFPLDRLSDTVINQINLSQLETGTQFYVKVSQIAYDTWNENFHKYSNQGQMSPRQNQSRVA